MNRTTAPRLRKAEKINITEPVVGRLSNGLPVYIIESGDQDIIRVDISLQAGSRQQDKIFQASFTNTLLREGTPKRTSRQIADELDFYGSYLIPVTDRDEAGLQLYSLGKFLPPTLDIAADILINPLFPEDEIDILKKNRFQSLSIEEKKVEYRARKIFFRALFGKDHPYGQTGETADLGKISKYDLEKFHKNYYQPEFASIIIAGKDAGKYMKDLEERFGAWGRDRTSGVAALRPVKKVVNKAYRKIIEDVPGAVQASIRMGCITPGKNHRDFVGLSIASTLLGGYFGSRLMQNIREDKGYTYGISSMLHSFKETGVFLIGTDVGLEYCQPTIQECYMEINRLAQRKVSKTELQRVRQYSGGELLRQLDGPYNQAESLKSLLTFGMDFDFIARYLEVLNNISPEEIRALTSKYIKPEFFVEVVAGVQGD